MNYIKEINMFYDWLEINSISDSSIVLWHALMHINNKCGWKTEFTVATSTLQVKTSLSKSSIIRARNQLKQIGRINFQQRQGNLSAIYSIISFNPEFACHTDTQSETQSDTQNNLRVTQTRKADANRHTKRTQIDTINKTKLNINNNSVVCIAPIKSFKQFSETDFKEDIQQYISIYGKDLCNHFFDYWTEKTAYGKMKFKLEKTWDTKRRLDTWQRNEQIFAIKNHQKESEENRLNEKQL